MCPVGWLVFTQPTLLYTLTRMRVTCHHLLRNLTRVMDHPWCMTRRTTRRENVMSLVHTYRYTLGASLPPPYYEIRVIGIPPPEVLLDFEQLSASVEPVETVLHGPLGDQAALHGLLARLQTLGVQVVEVRRLHDPAPPAPDSPAGTDLAGA